MPLDLLKCAPQDLTRNPWNTNRMSPEAELKLENSLQRHGFIRPILVRELEDGTLQILGGQHRVEIAERMGMLTIPVISLGQITDQEAKEIGLLDNARYGHDDADALGRLLAELGKAEDLAAFLPLDMSEMQAISQMTEIDLDTLELKDDDASPPVESKPSRIAKTHAVLRMKVPIEDQGTVADALKMIIEEQGFADSDSLVNAGDALMWLVREHLTAREAT